MKGKLFFIFFSSLLAVALSDDQSCPQTGVVFNCTDASSYTLCVSGNKYYLKCQNPNPYCVKGQGGQKDRCSNQKPAVTFKCPTTPGFYPDLKSDRIFYLCSSSGLFVSFDCGSVNGGFYNATLKSCDYFNTISSPFNCTGKKNATGVSYWQDRSIFAACMGEEPVQVMKCLAGRTFNDTSGNCEYQCTRPGVIPSESTKGFQVCYSSPLGVRALKASCPGNSVFNPASSLCVPLSWYKRG